jgi:hypothetical protein
MLGKGQYIIDTDVLQSQVGGYRGRDAKEKVSERPRLQWEGCSFPATPPQDYPLQQQQQPPRTSVAQACPTTERNDCPPSSLEAHSITRSQSLQAPYANSSSWSDMFKVLMIFHQIMTAQRGPSQKKIE